MSKKLEKVRVKGTQIRVPNKKIKQGPNPASTVFNYPVNESESNEPNTLRIKHVDLSKSFVETSPLYDLVISDFDDKDFRVLRYTKQDGTSEFFSNKRIGLISKRAVDILSITSL